VARSCPCFLNRRRRLRSRSVRRLGTAVWLARNNNQRQRGPQFTSALWAALCRLLDITHIPTTAYHPQSNGLVERFHRRLKDALRARAAGNDWSAHLPWVMLGIRSAWREETLFSPAEAVYGAQPFLPGQFLAAEEDLPPPSFFTDLQGILSGRTVLPTQHHSTAAPQQLPEDLLLAKQVLVRRDGHIPPLAAAYDGPFLVLERSLQFFKLQVGDKVDTFSTLRLKPCRSPPDVQVAQPPRRGSPPAAMAQPPRRESTPPPTTPLQQQQCRRRITFSCPVVKPTVQQQQQRFHPSGRPACNAGPPRRYILRLAHLQRPRLGGSYGKTTFDGGSLCFIFA
jgi:hypothetical protein